MRFVVKKAMEKESRGRLYQATTFVFTEFNGLPIEQVVVCADAATKEPILVYIKVLGNSWHQYFLDAGMGFWEELGISVLENEDKESYTHLVLTDEHDLRDKIIDKISCEEDANNSKIIIELEDKRQLVLKCINSNEFDSACELILQS